MSHNIEPEALAQIQQSPSTELIAQIRETLELSVDEFNHRGDFAALDELEARLAALDNDDAVMAGYRATRKMLVARVGGKHDHAEAFRKGMRGM